MSAHRKFTYRQKTVQLPWSPECREFFGLSPDEESPAFYCVTIQLKNLLFNCRVNMPNGWRNNFTRRVPNILNVSIMERLTK